MEDFFKRWNVDYVLKNKGIREREGEKEGREGENEKDCIKYELGNCDEWSYGGGYRWINVKLGS